MTPEERQHLRSRPHLALGPLPRRAAPSSVARSVISDIAPSEITASQLGSRSIIASSLSIDGPRLLRERAASRQLDTRHVHCTTAS
jgi:hypothetical protein